MKKILLLVFSILLFSLFFLMVKGEKGIKLAMHQKGDSFIEGMKLVNRKDGAPNWVLTARRADISGDGKSALLSGIEMKIEKEGVVIYADKGVYGMNDRKLSIEGKTVAKGSNYEITSEHVDFDSNGGNLRSDGAVKIDSAKFSVSGTGMDMDNAAQKVRIQRNVKAVFYR